LMVQKHVDINDEIRSSLPEINGKKLNSLKRCVRTTVIKSQN